MTEKWQTRPLVREGAPYGRDSNFQARINIWSWAPAGARHQDGQTDWPSVAMWFWLWHQDGQTDWPSVAMWLWHQDGETDWPSVAMWLWLWRYDQSQLRLHQENTAARTPVAPAPQSSWPTTPGPSRLPASRSRGYSKRLARHPAASHSLGCNKSIARHPADAPGFTNGPFKRHNTTAVAAWASPLRREFSPGYRNGSFQWQYRRRLWLRLAHY
jgi:hypothetical protein